MARRAILLLLAALLAPVLGRAAEPSIAVIVHPTRTGAFREEDVARIFLRKQRFWLDGSPIVPLNREAGSELREAFSQRIFDAGSAALAGYWNEQYFLGMFPPATLSSTLAVKRYVAAEPNAIGYIEAAAVDSSVRVVLELKARGR
jgi:ABC-type phosphate transport system substrate-binding protein